MSGLLFAVAAGGLAALVTTQLLESRRQRALRARFRRRRADLAALREGAEAAVHGRVRVAESTLEAPISGRACVAWEVVIHADARGGKLIRCAQALDFLLEESSGLVRVRAASDGPRIDGDGLRLAEDLDTRSVDAGGLVGGPTAGPTLRWWCARTTTPPPPELDTYLQRIRRLGVGAGPPPRIEERCLLPGDRASALGLVVRDDALVGVERRYREEASALVIAASPALTLVVTNDRFYF